VIPIPVTRPETLYALTPAVYRIADQEQGGPLRALMRVLEEPYRAIEADVGQMYDDWFIETCAPFLVPYIGELVGVGAAFDPAGAIPTVRARVGNALAYSRRKGSAWVLAHAAHDATGWQARAVEFFQLLSQTQDLGDVRPRLGRTADLRFPEAAEAGTPFDRMAHTVEVRGPDSRGRWAADRVGLSLWRLASYPLTRAQPRAVGPGRYTFHPFGLETPLFLPPRTAEPFGDEPLPWDVPGSISRELLALALEDARLRPDPREDGGYPIVAVWAGDGPKDAVPAPVVAADLSGWRPTLIGRTRREKADHLPLAAVDPELGRLCFVGPAPSWVRVDWSYGFSADLGGGPYARGPADPAPGADAFMARVGGTVDPPGAVQAGSVAAALEAWAQSSAPEGVVLIADSATHPLPPGWVGLTPGRRLWIIAAGGQRPCLTGDLRVDAAERAGVVLVGVAVDGTVRLRGQVDLSVSHCTLSPAAGGGEGDARPAVWADPWFTGTVTVSRSILGPLRVPRDAGGVSLADSIVAGEVYALASGSSDADAGPAAGLTVERCTLFGVVHARSLTAADSIFADPVLVDDCAVGGLAFCYAPPAPRMPPREICQPAPGSDVRPIFTSRRYGDAGFAQLTPDCPVAIRTGAGDGSEMGAFHLLANPRREANLRATVGEFLPNGLEVVLSFVT